jgi:hypothetical protein
MEMTMKGRCAEAWNMWKRTLHTSDFKIFKELGI